MARPSIERADRRREDRVAPADAVRVRTVLPVLPISDAAVLNTSPGGVALRTRVPLKVGDRLSFSVGADRPPILAEVLAADRLPDGAFRVRCRCLLGAFEAA